MTKKKVSEAGFWKSAIVVTIAKNLGSVFNFLLMIVAKALLTRPGAYGAWQALTAMTGVMSVPTQAFQTNIQNKVSFLVVKDKFLASLFYQKILRISHYFFLGLLIVSPVLVWIFDQVIGFSRDYGLAGLLILTVVLISNAVWIYYGANQGYLEGVVALGSVSFSLIIIWALRFFITTGLLWSGFELWSIAIGFLLAITISAWIAHFLVAKYNNKTKLEFNHTIEQEKQALSKISQDFANSIKDSLLNIPFLLAVYLFLNIDIMLAPNLMNGGFADQYGLISTFGQIFHFGPIAFGTLMIPFVARNGNKSLVLTLQMIFVLSLLAGGFFWLLNTPLLWIFGESSSSYIVNLILLYSIYITFYNLIFTLVQFLIAHRVYKILTPFLLITGLYWLALFLSPRLDLDFNIVERFIWVNLGFSILATIFLGIVTYFWTIKNPSFRDGIFGNNHPHQLTKSESE